MAAFLGSSSSTKQYTGSQAAGFSEIAGPATSVNLSFQGKVSKKATFAPQITLTDQGAIKEARAIAEQSGRQVELFAGTLASALGDAFAGIQSSTGQAIEAVSSSNRSETENLGLAALKWGALAFGAYALARIFWKGA